eukprot:EG_transcript_4810
MTTSLEMTYSQVPAPETAIFEPIPTPTGAPSASQEEVMFDFGDATKSLRLDPRNNLTLVTVPGELAKTGGVEWNASVIYWFGVVDRCTQWWRKERRMVLVGDETLYVAFPGSIVTRCIPIKGIKSILVSHDQKWINVLMMNEHDLRFTCLEPCTGSREGKSVTAFLGAVATLWGHMYRKPLPTYRMPASTNFKEVLNLSKNTWKWGQHGPVVPPRPREELFAYLIQNGRAAGLAGTMPKGASMPTFPRSIPRSMVPYDVPESDPVAYGLPPSATRPPVSAGNLSSRGWSSETREDDIPLSARRPPVSAPYYDRLESSMKKTPRASSRGSGSDNAEDRDSDQGGEEDSDASGRGSGRAPRGADVRRDLQRTLESADASPMKIPVPETPPAPAYDLPPATKPAAAAAPPPLPETRPPVPETRRPATETFLPMPEGTGTLPMPSEPLPPSATPAKKAFVFPSVNSSA